MEQENQSTAKQKASWPSLVALEVVTLGLGGLTGFLMRGSMNVYDTIQKPSFAPPPWLFPVAWSVLYIAMALSAWLILREKRPGWKSALWLYAIQLAVNLAWPWLFFVQRAFGLAFLWLMLLLALVVWFMCRAFAQRKLAGWLLVPYALWVTFAGALNFMIARLNP